MAIYAMICDKCGSEFDISCSYDGLKEYKCFSCESDIRQNYSKKTLVCDNTLGYYDRGLGAYIGSTSDKRKIMNERGIEPASSYNSSYSSTKVKKDKMSDLETKKMVSEAYDIAKSRSRA